MFSPQKNSFQPLKTTTSQLKNLLLFIALAALGFSSREKSTTHLFEEFRSGAVGC